MTTYAFADIRPDTWVRTWAPDFQKAPKEIVTKRLRLLALDYDRDINGFTELLTDDRMLSFFPPNHPSLTGEIASNLCKSWIQNFGRSSIGYAAYTNEASDSRFIGLMEGFHQCTQTGWPGVAFCTVPNEQRKGYATEGLKALLDTVNLLPVSAEDNIVSGISRPEGSQSSNDPQDRMMQSLLKRGVVITGRALSSSTPQEPGSWVAWTTGDNEGCQAVLRKAGFEEKLKATYTSRVRDAEDTDVRCWTLARNVPSDHAEETESSAPETSNSQ